MKYIMFVSTLGKPNDPDPMLRYCPLIFPDFLVHAEVAQGFIKSRKACPYDPREYRVHSAGFISPMGMECHGESESLGVKSDPLDTNRIACADYGGLLG